MLLLVLVILLATPSLLVLISEELSERSFEIIGWAIQRQLISNFREVMTALCR